MTDLTTPAASPFDAIRHTRDDGTEYWSARELMPLLGYDQWRRFEDCIERAVAAIANAGLTVQDHVAASGNMVQIGSGAERYVQDHRLTRYGSYMVAQNGDPRKPEVAAAQTYFAIKTREAEVAPALDEIEVAERYLAALREKKALEAKVVALEPPARSWNALANSAGDYDMRDAAQILCRDPFINIGRNRLAKYLREIGWLDHRGIPYQRYVDQRLLDSKPQTRTSHRTGERIACDPQVRITLKGLGKLHHLLGGTETLAIDTPTDTDPLEAIA